MKRIFIVLLLLALSFGFSQQNQLKHIQNLDAQAKEAIQKKDYEKAIGLYQKILTFPEAEEHQVSIFHDLSCCYSLTKQTERGFEALERSLKKGFSNFKWMNSDSDFTFLKAQDKNRFLGLVEKAKENSKVERFIRSPMAVMEYDNYTGSCDISKHIWDVHSLPEFKMLRENYQLENIIEKEQTEFDKMLLVLDWVANRWKHTGSNEAEKHNALWILEEVGKGKRFRCVEYSIVLANCLTVLGFPARTVGLQREGVAYGTGKGHVCTEVWSNQYNKWILLDGQNNAYWKHKGILLNAHECRLLFINGKENEMEMVTQLKNVNPERMKTSWAPHFYHLKHSFDNTFFREDSDQSSHSKYRLEFLTKGIHPEIYFQGRPQNIIYLDDENEVYPVLNQTSIRLFHSDMEKPTKVLKVIPLHTMPYFEKFQVRIDEGDWMDKKETFLWTLKDGLNTIEIKAVNLLGIEGKTSKIVLKNNISN